VVNSNVDGIRGEYRRLSATEIGIAIRLFRQQHGLKRAALAADANMSEKTLERAEAGQGISEESCRRIASALGIEADAFTREMYVPTGEEAERRVKQDLEERHANYAPMPVSELKGVRDVLPAFRADGFLGDDSHVAEEHMAKFAELKQSIWEWNAVASDINEPELIDGCKSFMSEVRDFEALGYIVKCGTTTRYRKDKTPVSLAVLVAFKKPKGVASTPVEVWLPKKVSMGF
jgi:transcriptional regulator with XRE-family HTH domain